MFPKLQFERQYLYLPHYASHNLCLPRRKSLSESLNCRKYVAIFERPLPSVETCIAMCGLEKFADAIVGSLGVEHRKRLTIAVELAAKVSYSVPWQFFVLSTFHSSSA